MLNPVLDRWRLTALVVSAAMLATAHGFETFGGLAPCHLCLLQRDVYWTAGGLALAFMVLVRLPGGARFRQLTCWILGLAFLVGAGIAIFHAGAEWKFWPAPQSCSGVASGGVSTADLAALMNGAKFRPPACDQPAWVFAGLSMAGWNAVASLALVGLSVAAALREKAKG
jgi:disulfide bond formation protein DsbB